MHSSPLSSNSVSNQTTTLPIVLTETVDWYLRNGKQAVHTVLDLSESLPRGAL